MKKDDRLHLQDILDCIQQIKIYIGNLDWENFKTDEKTKDAILRNLEILGEAANRLSNNFRDKYSKLELYKAIGMRNQLIHGYDKIKLRIIWTTIEKDLPKLEKQIKKILL